MAKSTFPLAKLPDVAGTFAAGDAPVMGLAGVFAPLAVYSRAAVDAAVATRLAAAANLADVADPAAAFDAISGLAALGDLVYGGADGARATLAGNTAAVRKFLTQTGDGANSAAPAWAGPLANDDLPRPIAPAPVLLADAATIATDASLGNLFRVTLGGNRTLGNVTGATDGQRITWEFVQGSPGGRTLTLGTGFKLGTDLTDVTLSTTAGAADYLTGVYNAADGKVRVVALARGF